MDEKKNNIWKKPQKHNYLNPRPVLFSKISLYLNFILWNYFEKEIS